MAIILKNEYQGMIYKLRHEKKYAVAIHPIDCQVNFI